MTRVQTHRLVWNGVIYGTAFAAAMLITAFMEPPLKIEGATATLLSPHPVAQISQPVVATKAALR